MSRLPGRPRRRPPDPTAAGSRLSGIKAGGPFELTIDGTNHLAIKEVLIGEVWVAGGQSNMEMHVGKAAVGAEAAAAANDTQIRFFKVGGALPFEPTREFGGNWQTCTPENVKSWSAAAYFFARDLRGRSVYRLE